MITLDQLLSTIPDLDKQVASDYLAVRKAKKLPLTFTALNAVIRNGAKCGLSAAETITICAENSWAGFKPEWLAQAMPTRTTEWDWVKSNETVEQKGRELGLPAKMGETHQAYKTRLIEFVNQKRLN